MILNTTEAVIALGGFKGHDPVLSTERLEQLVAEGAVRYFLLEPRSRRKDGAARWIMTHCAQVPKSAWQLDPGASGKRSNGIDDPLYDCRGALGVKDATPT
jgi:hypothetical protein